MIFQFLDGSNGWKARQPPVSWICGFSGDFLGTDSEATQCNPSPRKNPTIWDFFCLETIWMFPKIVVPPNHPMSIGFSIINHPFWGTPNFRKHPFWTGNHQLNSSFEGDSFSFGSTTSESARESSHQAWRVAGREGLTNQKFRRAA